MATALVRVASGNERRATAALKLPARSAADELAANRAVLDAPTLPALERYAGIVYDGLDVATLTAAARRQADAAVLIFSGLFGVLRADEPVPAYRLPASAALPRLGVLASYWRPLLDELMPALVADEFVVDLRSSDYGAMWRPSAQLRSQVLAVRVLTGRPGHEPTVISYSSKLAKGRLTRALVSRRGRVTTAAHVVDAWRSCGGLAAVETATGLELIN